MKRTSVAQPDVATLFIAASEQDSNLYYATKFMAPDPFIYLEPLATALAFEWYNNAVATSAVAMWKNFHEIWPPGGATSSASSRSWPDGCAPPGPRCSPPSRRTR